MKPQAAAGGTMGRSSSNCRCRRAAPADLWEAGRALRESYFQEFPGYYKTSDAGYKDEDGYVFGDGAAPTTSSTSPGHRFPPAAWKRSWPLTPTSPMRGAGIKDAIKGEVPLRFPGAEGRRDA